MWLQRTKREGERHVFTRDECRWIIKKRQPRFNKLQMHLTKLLPIIWHSVRFNDQTEICFFFTLKCNKCLKGFHHWRYRDNPTMRNESIRIFSHIKQLFALLNEAKKTFDEKETICMPVSSSRRDFLCFDVYLIRRSGCLCPWIHFGTMEKQ